MATVPKGLQIPQWIATAIEDLAGFTNRNIFEDVVR